MSGAHHHRAAAWELYFTTTARLTERIEAALKCQSGLSMPEYSVLLMTDRAGEAGIRVSGDVNLAALQVLNAANIQVEGEATGIPQAVVVDTGALTAASAAANAVIAQAAALQERARPQVAREIPSILIVRFVGFGDD